MASKSAFFACSCYYTHQIFLENLRLHVKYLGRAQFIADYGQLLEQKYHIKDESSMEAILAKIEAEVERRKNQGDESRKRIQTIREKYKPLHPDIFNLKDQFFSSDFQKLIQYTQNQDANTTGVKELLNVEDGDQLYSFPVFTDEFCRLMVEELKHFEEADLPKGRPNTMNNSGVLLDELGFYDQFITPLRLLLEPLCRLLYPEWVGHSLDSHKAFTVTYQIHGDTELTYHYDNSEVTLNICLGQSFQDGDLYLGPMRQETGSDRFTRYCHRIGRGLLHRGQQHHGAEPISDGERYNLIIWMRASSVRNKLCPMCNERPKLVPSKGFGDGFTESATYCTTL